MGLSQRQTDHERVGQYVARQQHLTGQSDRDYKQCRQREVRGEHPFGQAQILRINVLDHRDVKLPWQADDRHHRDAGLYYHRRPINGFFPVFLEARGEHGLIEQVVETVVEAVGDERADGEKGEQLDQRLKGNRQHHAAVVLGGVEVARAEDDGEQRQHQ